MREIHKCHSDANVIPSLSATLWVVFARKRCSRNFWNVCRWLGRLRVSFLRWFPRSFRSGIRSWLHLKRDKQTDFKIAIPPLRTHRFVYLWRSVCWSSLWFWNPNSPIWNQCPIVLFSWILFRLFSPRRRIISRAPWHFLKKKSNKTKSMSVTCLRFHEYLTKMHFNAIWPKDAQNSPLLRTGNNNTLPLTS